MKAFLIDPPTATITEVDYNGDWKTIAPMLGCDLFTTVQINAQGDAIYVDDEGLINGNDQGWFKVAQYPDPLRGKGLVLGSSPDGDSSPPFVTLEQLQRDVTFPKSDLDVRAMLADSQR